MLAVAMATGSVRAMLSVANVLSEGKQGAALPPSALESLAELEAMRTNLELSFPTPKVSEHAIK
jgi:hypothetical protein